MTVRRKEFLCVGCHKNKIRDMDEYLCYECKELLRLGKEFKESSNLVSVRINGDSRDHMYGFQFPEDESIHDSLRWLHSKLDQLTGSDVGWTGMKIPEDNVPLWEEYHKRIYHTCERFRKDGIRQGQNLLAQMANGDITLRELDRQIFREK